jgi:nitric oxide reductase NorQ protein
VSGAPFYLPGGDEVDVFLAAHLQRIPVMLTGPTGCGKTRFVEYMVWRIAAGQEAGTREPLITVTCHDDMTAADLVGRYLLDADGTTWLDGPLTRAVRTGAVCYLDEIVEARKDTTVILHALTDHRRILPIERLGSTLAAHPDFMLVCSYNPGYQSGIKDLKPSTRQRFVTLAFGYPEPQREQAIIAHEASIDDELAGSLAFLGARLRNLDDADVIDGPSTRLLVYVGVLIRNGIGARRACEAALVQALSDDRDIQDAIREVTDAVFAA